MPNDDMQGDKYINDSNESQDISNHTQITTTSDDYNPSWNAPKDPTEISVTRELDDGMNEPYKDTVFVYKTSSPSVPQASEEKSTQKGILSTQYDVKTQENSTQLNVTYTRSYVEELPVQYNVKKKSSFSLEQSNCDDEIRASTEMWTAHRLMLRTVLHSM
jgi:hypothetical protein